jgi:hypothetical protein
MAAVHYDIEPARDSKRRMRRVTTPRAVCPGCGGEVPPRRGHGNPRKWCSERCRKRQYGFDPCVDCGGPTSSGPGNGRHAEPLCHTCAYKRNIVWTRGLVIARICEWNERYGAPPAIPDWNAHAARADHNEERALRFEEARPYWPWFSTVIKIFGSWNAGIAAAGFKPRQNHGGNGNQAYRLQRKDDNARST